MKENAECTYKMYEKTGLSNIFKLARKNNLSRFPFVCTGAASIIFWIISIISIKFKILSEYEFYMFLFLTATFMVFFFISWSFLTKKILTIEPILFGYTEKESIQKIKNTLLDPFINEFSKESMEFRLSAEKELAEYLDEPHTLEKNKLLINSLMVITIPTLFIRFEEDIKNTNLFLWILISSLAVGFVGKVILKLGSFKRLKVNAILKLVKKMNQEEKGNFEK